MRIASVQVENYKSFYHPTSIQLTPGFNVVIGQNNVGKTALLEALSLRLESKPHRSQKTVRIKNTAVLDSVSKVEIIFELESDEVPRIMRSLLLQQQFFVKEVPGQDVPTQVATFRAVLSGASKFRCVYANGSPNSAYLEEYGEQKFEGRALRYRLGKDEQIELASDELINPGNDQAAFGVQMAGVLKDRIYMFKAERLNVSTSGIGTSEVLEWDARNLPQVLNLLQTRNPPRFGEFNRLVGKVFPQITQITAPIWRDGIVHIFVWETDPALQLDDLAIELSDSGTGIGQVLAILYVVLTADYPKTIFIDEPQTFLHPGAVRKLFDILKQTFPQHQYIITTHSATAITAAEPRTLFHMRKEGAESSVVQVDVAELQQIRLCLLELGVRLSDVFGGDNVLWVEGKTEELCFPKILTQVAHEPQLGTVILGVMQVGDFEGKHAQKTFEMYRRLSEAHGFVPQILGFIFDEEVRSAEGMEDLVRRGGGAVHFTPRRMYENYLLNSGAIAFVMSQIPDFSETKITPERVTEWLHQDRWDDRKFFNDTVPQTERTAEVWLQKVHAARILGAIFEELSGGRFTYDKVEHGLKLTEWIIEHAHTELTEIAGLIKSILGH